MIKNNPEKMVDFLNELVKTDSEALSKLIEVRVKCNDALADHPTVQVMGRKDKPPVVGLLGLLNGYFGTYDDGPKKGWGGLLGIMNTPVWLPAASWNLNLVTFAQSFCEPENFISMN